MEDLYFTLLSAVCFSKFAMLFFVKPLVSDTIKENIEDLLEDLTALSSKEYLTSIREAREDYKHGRVKSIEEIDV